MQARWIIPVVVVILIAVGWLFWNRSQQEPAVSPVAQQPAAPPPPPAAPAPKQPVSASVLFEFDRAVLRKGDLSKLDELVAAFKSGGYDRVGAVGYADRIGAEQYNLVLSQRRADAVNAYLADKGVNYQAIRTEARGESEATTGDRCKSMGKETKRNRKLIECLQPDRRAVITVMATK